MGIELKLFIYLSALSDNLSKKKQWRHRPSRTVHGYLCASPFSQDLCLKGAGCLACVLSSRFLCILLKLYDVLYWIRDTSYHSRFLNRYRKPSHTGTGKGVATRDTNRILHKEVCTFVISLDFQLAVVISASKRVKWRNEKRFPQKCPVILLLRFRDYPIKHSTKHVYFFLS